MIVFASSFLSYLLLFVILVVLCSAAIAIGITLRKKKNIKEANSEAVRTEE